MLRPNNTNTKKVPLQYTTKTEYYGMRIMDDKINGNNQLKENPIATPQPQIQETKPKFEEVPEESVAMPKKSIIVFPTVILLVIISIIAGYLLYQNYQLRTQISRLVAQIPTPTAEPTPFATLGPTATPDVTANWKTYTNIKYGYQLRYPNDWSVTENSGQDTVGGQIQNTTFTSPTKDYVLTLGVRKSGETVNIVGRSGVSAGDFVISNPIPFNGSSIPTKNLIYKGKIKAVFYQPEVGLYKASDFEFYADFDRVTYDDYEARDISNLPELAVANQILSTFKFLE
jgi:hypothetical protein